MAAVAVAKLDVLDSQMKQKSLRRTSKLRRRLQSNDEVTKRKALKSCIKTVEVAQNQLCKDLIFQLVKKYHVELDSYQSQSIKFLEIPVKQDVDIWFLVDHLKKFYVVLKQMMKELSDRSDYYESLKNASSQISQLIEILKLTATLITGLISPKKGYPALPEELKAETSKSKRQNRDYLFVREYKKFLEVVEEVLKKFQ